MISASPIIFNEEYSSLEDLSFGAKRWKLDFKKISPGKLLAGLKMIDTGLVQLAEIKLKGMILQDGAVPENYTTFVIPGDEMQSFKWQYYDIDSNSLLIMPKDNQFSAITNDNFHVFTISVHKDLITKRIEENNLNTSPDKLFIGGQIYPISKNYSRFLISYFNVLFYDFLSLEISYSKQEELMNIVNKLTQSLLGYVNGHEAKIPQAKKRKVDEAALKFNTIYNCSAIPDLSIPEFCLNHKIKQRTLEKAINEYYGISPIALLKALKLNKFRKKLLNSNLPVSEVARVCGYKHLGQLSADYKKLFDELPKDTVNRVKHQFKYH